MGKGNQIRSRGMARHAPTTANPVIRKLTNKLRKYQPDILAIIALILLWLLFFWRLFTPIAADQVSLMEGDFSGQFVAFGAYQYERFTAGEIPLWNPYNNGGLPFIGDTQAAVLYPPRLITIALSSLSGGWHYNSLQMEMTAHVLLYTLLMYALVRRMTSGQGTTSALSGFVAAIIAGYGGFMAGYPPLQLALLEAGIWLPLALLGLVEATRREKFAWSWLLLTGFALGLSWLAGHPQTSWFATYLIVAYLGYRVYAQKYRWQAFVGGTALIAIITIGIAAVTLLPSLEYLGHSMRTGMGFDDKSNGFPIRDVIQFLFPSIASIWSPLYVGVSGLALAVIALLGKERERVFWGLVAVIALGLSFGRNCVVFHALYNILPGLRYFRGQERAAFLVANSLAILAGMGVATLYSQIADAHFMARVKRGLIRLALICGLSAGAILVAWVGYPDRYSDAIEPMVLSAIVAVTLLFPIPQIIVKQRPRWWNLIAAVVILELFTVNIDNSNYEATPAEQHSLMTLPPLVERVREDTALPYRVDGSMVGGRIGIYGRGNAGSMYQLQDLRGISPLFLDGPHAIIQRELPPEVAWELFAVKYVFTDWEVLPVASELIARDYPNGQTLNLHRLSNPRPFALLMSDYVIAANDEAARRLLADPNFDARAIIILEHDPGIDLPDAIPGNATATVADFAPERFTIQVDATTNAILSVAQVDYPGWKVEIDGARVEPIRAYGALIAVPIAAGEHRVTFTYNPLSYRIGAILSLATWVAVGILGLILPFRHRKNHANE